MMKHNTFFISDTHFGHQTMAQLRGFTSVDEMNDFLIERWNLKVRNRDTVYITGDLFFRCDPKKVINILETLSGEKFLLKGNHDGSWLANCPDSKRHFKSIDLMTEKSIGNHGFTLCHYPLLTYKHQKKHFMIHGHLHDETNSDLWPLLKVRPHVLNAGVDINKYEPVELDELIDNNNRWKSQN